MSTISFHYKLESWLGWRRNIRLLFYLANIAVLWSIPPLAPRTPPSSGTLLFCTLFLEWSFRHPVSHPHFPSMLAQMCPSCVGDPWKLHVKLKIFFTPKKAIGHVIFYSFILSSLQRKRYKFTNFGLSLFNSVFSMPTSLPVYGEQWIHVSWINESIYSNKEWDAS